MIRDKVVNSGDAGAGRITEEPRSLGGQGTWNHSIKWKYGI